MKIITMKDSNMLIPFAIMFENMEEALSVTMISTSTRHYRLSDKQRDLISANYRNFRSKYDIGSISSYIGDLVCDYIFGQV